MIIVLKSEQKYLCSIIRKTESFLRVFFLFLGKLLTKNERKRGNYFSSPLCLQSDVSKFFYLRILLLLINYIDLKIQLLYTFKIASILLPHLTV